MADDDAHTHRRETYGVFSGPETVLPRRRWEGTNSARFAVVGALGHAAWAGFRDTSEGTSETLSSYGFSDVLIDRGLREPRMSSESQHERERTGYPYLQGREWAPTSVRARSWSDLNDGNLAAQTAFLASGLCSPLERESAAAAVGLLQNVADSPRPPRSSLRRRWLEWRWEMERYLPEWWLPELWPTMSSSDGSEPDETLPWNGANWSAFMTRAIAIGLRYEDEYLPDWLQHLAMMRISIASRSADPIVREFAGASALRLRALNDERGGRFPRPDSAETPRSAQLASTMVHGTWGWKGDWWHSGGDFHSYVRSAVRPRLYKGGRPFSWSGALSQPQRAKAGEFLFNWIRAGKRTEGLETLFGHSYGGDVAAHAVNRGSRVRELVLLSAPVTTHVEAALSRVERTIDVRLKFDIVLWLARERQTLPPGAGQVVSVMIPGGMWSHSATHSPSVWTKEKIAAKARL